LPTVVDGSVIQAAWGNQVKANFDASPNGLASAAGQLFYATATGTLVALPVGATAAFLQIAGGAPAWAPSPQVAAGQQILFLPNAALYCPTAGNLRTDANLLVGGGMNVNQALGTQVNIGAQGANAGLAFGALSDANLYRAGPGALRTDGTIQAAAFLPAPGSARARRTTTLAIATSWTPIGFDAEDWDNAGLHAAGTPNRFVAPVAGVYHAWGTGAIQQGPGNLNPILAIRDSAANHLARQDGVPNATNSFAYLSVGCEVKLAAGDWIEVAAIVNGTGTGTLLADGASTPAKGGLSYLGPG
jgi:hypothetical protein